MPSIGPTGFILIIVVALLLSGPSKLPELGRAFGKTLREFKNGAKDIMSDDDQSNRKEVNTQQAPVQQIEQGQAQQYAQAPQQQGQAQQYVQVPQQQGQAPQNVQAPQQQYNNAGQAPNNVPVQGQPGNPDKRLPE